jgi:hypothetical protein
VKVILNFPNKAKAVTIVLYFFLVDKLDVLTGFSWQYGYSKMYSAVDLVEFHEFLGTIIMFLLGIYWKKTWLSVGATGAALIGITNLVLH